MNQKVSAITDSHADVPNGSGAAALLAAGIGCFALAVLAVAGDASPFLKCLLIFYRPTGPLSGVTTVTLLVWLACWAILEQCWRKRTVALGRVSTIALALLGMSLLLTFPPIADLF